MDKTPTEIALTAAIAAAQADLSDSIDKASLRRDPSGTVLGALSSVLDIFPRLIREMRTVAAEARHPLDAAGMARVEEAAAKGASSAANALVRAHYRRSVLIGTLAMVGCIGGGGGGGYWWGRSQAIQQFSASEAGFAELMHDDPDAATGWLKVSRLNDYRQIMSGCKGDQLFVQAGQKACATALWLEAPQASAPKPR